MLLTFVPVLRCDAKERSGREFLRGVQVLQTGDHQEPHRAPLHDRTPQGECARTRPGDPDTLDDSEHFREWR